MDNGIVLVDFDNIRSLKFIMIRKFVLVNKNVTDFFCVFGIYGYNRFLYYVWTSSRAFYVY